MMYAHGDGQRVEAYPGAQGATCPLCHHAVIPKCGRIVVWHWAHRPPMGECDSWAEPDNAWHREWQLLVPAERREVTFGQHRADMVSTTGVVVEVQHSGLSVEEIEAREAFYGKMIWIFDARDAVRQGRLELRTKQGRADGYRTFRWKHARKSIRACSRVVWLDVGEDQVFRLGKMYPGAAPIGGWGHLYAKADLVLAINATPSDFPPPSGA